MFYFLCFCMCSYYEFMPDDGVIDRHRAHFQDRQHSNGRNIFPVMPDNTGVHDFETLRQTQLLV